MAPSATATTTEQQLPVREPKILTHVGAYKEIATNPNYNRSAEEEGDGQHEAAKV